MTDKKRNKWAFLVFAIKAIAGIGGVSMVLEQSHPYLAVAVLIMGAVANEAITYFKLKK